MSLSRSSRVIGRFKRIISIRRFSRVISRLKRVIRRFKRVIRRFKRVLSRFRRVISRLRRVIISLLYLAQLDTNIWIYTDWKHFELSCFRNMWSRRQPIRRKHASWPAATLTPDRDAGGGRATEALIGSET